MKVKNFLVSLLMMASLVFSNISITNANTPLTVKKFAPPTSVQSFFDWQEYYNGVAYPREDIIISDISTPGLATDSKYDWAASVMFTNGEYRMWWTRQKLVSDGNGRDAIYYADSWDGVNWYHTQEVLVASDIFLNDGINDTSQEKFHVARPSVVRIESTYYMFYESPMTLVNGGEKGNQIFVATSVDGKSWNKGPNNNSPVPIIKACDPTCPANYPYYGIGQPSVFYKDGNFWIFFTDATGTPPDNRTAQGNRIRLLRLSKSNIDNRQSVYWYPNSQFISYGSAVDVKWSSSLSEYVLLYSTLNNFSSPDTYNVCVFTSPDGVNYYPNNQNNILFQSCVNSSVNNITAGWPSKTRRNPTLVGDSNGHIPFSSLQVYFTEGTMHSSAGGVHQFISTWNLRYGIASLNGDPLRLPWGINVKNANNAAIYHTWINELHVYSNWNCFSVLNNSRLNYLIIPDWLLLNTPLGAKRC